MKEEEKTQNQEDKTAEMEVVPQEVLTEPEQLHPALLLDQELGNYLYIDFNAQQALICQDIYQLIQKADPTKTPEGLFNKYAMLDLDQ